MEVRFPLILDGATGTQLQKMGYDGSEMAEKWVLAHPETIQTIQKNYINAGSNVVYACTFSGNPIKMAEQGLEAETERYNRKLAALSREAAADHAWVAGDLAPTGKFLKPVGDVSFDELFNNYLVQAKALDEAGVDLFVIETMMTVSDARAAILAIRSFSKKPVFVSFSCDTSGRTVFGSDIVAVLEIMQGMEINAFGMNCSVGPEDMLAQLKRLHAYSEIPLIAKPNAGLPEMIDGKTVYNCSPEEFAAVIPEFAAAGAMIFGGCCGTDERYIRRIKEALQGVRMVTPENQYKNMLPLATEKALFMLPADTECTAVLACNDQLEDNFEQAEGNVIGLKIDSEASVEALEHAQYAFDRPVCFYCEDPLLLEKALRVYQGRAMYEGALSEDILEPMHRRYGLIY